MTTLATFARAMGSFAVGLMVCTAPASAQEGAPSAASEASEADAAITIPPGYESGAALASPTAPRTSTVIDTERPPSFGGRAAEPLAPPPPPSPPPPPDGHTLPIRLADRPLTLTEGTGRIDHGIMLQTAAGGILARMNVGASLGVTEDLEIGVSWPIEGDPTIQATGRLFHEGPFELGVRGAVMIPAITTGNTNARVGMPLVLRGGPVRFLAVPTLDLLFTANVSVLLALPAQLAITAGRVFSFGAQGWIGLVDGRVAQGDLFGFVNFTAHNGRRALMDARIAMGYAPAEGHLIFTTSLSFYPQFY